MPQEEVAEPEARDHARDDFPIAPPRRMREPEDRGAGEQEGPPSHEGFFRRVAPQDAASQVSPRPADVAARRSRAVAGRTAVYVHDAQHDGSHGHREADQEEPDDD